MSASASSDSTDPAEWLRYARSDLGVAAVEPWGSVLLETLTYHAQQAAEKACKAVLLHHGTPLPRTHDIVLLTDLTQEAGAGPVPIDAFATQRLTEYAVLSRYPSDLGEVGEAEWHQAVADARAVVEWAEGVVARPNT